jgi:hypothetical protein
MPSLRSGRPLVSSPPTGKKPRHALPANRMRMRSLLSSGSAKNTFAYRKSSRTLVLLGEDR